MSLSARKMKSESIIEKDASTSKGNKRSGLMKDLEIAVQEIMSQGETSDTAEEVLMKESFAVTPKRIASKAVLDHSMLSVERSILAPITPRRSTRKSVKPVQEYEEIVRRKRQLHSASKSQAEQNDTDTNDETAQPKWTPAKVGRTSEKRARKSRRTVGDKNKKKETISSSESEEVQNSNEIISVANLEEKENENPTEMKEEAEENINKENKIIVANENLEESKFENVIEEKHNLKRDSLLFSDLGLNLLDDDDSSNEKSDNNKVELEKPMEIGENLPVQLSVESSESEIEKSQETQDTITINDDTFNTSDCVIVGTGVCVPEEEEEEEIQTLQISDTEECNELLLPPKQNPKIVLTTEDDVITTILSTTTETVAQATMPSTVSPAITPKRLSKSSTRIPTPYKPKENVENVEYTQEQDDLENESNVLPVTIAISAIEPKESVLRSIRKRSISICIGDTREKLRAKSKNVTFYSPANQTAILEDFDILVEKSITKKPLDDSAKKSTFVTERRRRSKSFDESILKKTKPQKNFSVSSTPNKSRPTPQKTAPTRSKLPNFAAIHQKQFENMENLVDHVNRKKERAKELINSAVKTRKAFEQKGPPQKNQQIAITASAEKPKALKRINLDVSTMQTNLTLNKTTDREVETQSKLVAINLPDPRVGIIKPMTMNTTKTRNKQPTPAKNALKPVQLNQVPTRPAFNLSTSVHSHSVRNQTVPVTMTNNSRATTATIVKPTAIFDDKIATRRQRHMDMFKGRTANARAGADKQFIRGVRSNRRFQLQMQHRLNMDQN